MIAAYAQLRLARPLATELRRPWEKPPEPNKLTPARVRRGFRNLCTKIGSPASAPKPSRPDPGRPPGSKNRRPATRHDEPGACVLDAQSVKTSANVPAAGHGIDAGKKIAGRKPHLTLPKVTPASRRRGPTAATAPRPSIRAPAEASTSKSPAATPPRSDSSDSATLGRRADLRLAHAPRPPPRRRPRNPPTPLRSPAERRQSRTSVNHCR